MSPRKEIIDQLKLQIKSLPQSPGVYQYFDVGNKIIYVGKAKNLKKELLPILIKKLVQAESCVFWFLKSTESSLWWLIRNWMLYYSKTT